MVKSSYLYLPHRRKAFRSFNPLSIAGCKLWLRADTITGLTDGQALTTWLDESGNVNNATQGTEANKPLYKTNIQNGRPVVRFDGADDVMTANSAASLFHGNDTPISVFFVASTADNAANKCVFNGGYSAGQTYFHWFGFDSAEVLRVDRREELSTDQVASGGAAVSGFVCASFVFPGTTMSIWRNAQVVVNAAAFDTPTLGTNVDRIGIGALVRNATAIYLPGDIAEILIYNTALSTANRQAVEAYLNAKWAVY